MQIGDIRIDRIVDLETGVLPMRGFPDLTPESLKAYATRLGPRFIEAESLQLIISFNAYLVRTKNRTILVDSCIGADKARPHIREWNMRRGHDFLDRLAANGVAPEMIDAVMCTHMHADHVGWNTRLVNGEWVPTFPNARYLMADKEYNYMCEQTERQGAGFAQGCFQDSVLPVVKSGQAEIVGVSHRVEAGVHTEPAPGHTPGSVIIHIGEGAEHAICIGDLIHHPFQLFCPESPTAFCDDPLLAARQRVTFCERYAESGTVVLTGHFPAPAMGRIVRRDAAFDFDYVAG